MAIASGTGRTATAYRFARCQQFDIHPATRATQQTDNHDVKQLESMGKAVRIQEEPDGCLSGSCKSCPEGKACLHEWWALR
ncbi:ferrous iron transporter C [Escherichia coli]|uniref:ferrous iron transporter C n=1 Tax=Escherichia coli TaxID=562 RepID=UPI0020774E4C|nr:ferrous iron transporter C [Escherichia coli]